MTPGAASPEDPGLPAITDLVARLAERHHVRVVSLRHPTHRTPYRHAGAVIHPLGFGLAGGPVGRARVLAAAVRTVRRLHAEQPFQVLHALWADEAGTAAVAAGRWLRRPVVVSVLGGEVVAIPEIGYGTALGRGGRWTVSAALRGADLVTAGSSVLVERLGRRVPADRLSMLPLGVDPSRFSPGVVASPLPARFLHVGSLEPVKDQVTLLRAFARVVSAQPEARLEIAGHGSLREPLGRLADRLAITDAVEWLGDVPRADLVDRYRRATALVVSSRWEAQSMAAVEAAACGTPVVGTSVGCLPDLGDGAVTVPVGDHVALADAMVELAADPDRRRARSRAARGIAVERFALDDAAERFEAAYERVTR